MAGYNRVIMVGNLTRDPDHKQLSSGQTVCRLGIASNRQFKNKQTGDMVQEVCYVDVDVWGPQADSCNQYLKKGRQVLVEGRLKFDSWEDNDGNNRNKLSVVADRIVFLFSAQSESIENDQKDRDDDYAFEKKSSSTDKELMTQLDRIKERVGSASRTQSAYPEKQAMKTEQETVSKGAQEQQSTPIPATFKDEPPFKDDLPF